MPSVDALSLYQVGVQSAFGTNVACTAQLAVNRVDFEEVGTMFRPRLAKGLMVRNRGNEIATMFGTQVRIPETPVYYEQLQLFLNSFLKGGVTADGSDPYTWTFARSLTADPALKYLTLERRVKDFSTSEDMEVGDVLFNQVTFRYAEGGLLTMEWEGFGRKADDSITLTGSLSMPTPEFVPSALLKAYIDANWAGLGGTQVTSQIIGAELVWKNGAMPQMTADGRTALDYTLAIHNPDEMQATLKMTALMDPTTFAAERDAAKAGTLRAVRLQSTGSASRDLKLDGLFKYSKPGILMLGEQNGQVIASYELEESTDGTNWIQAIVVNKTNEVDGV